MERLMKGNLCSSCGLCVCVRCGIAVFLRVDCAALQGFYAALFVGSKGTLYLVVSLVAGVNMKSGRVHLEGEGVAGAVHAGGLYAYSGGIQCVDGIKIDAGLAVG